MCRSHSGSSGSSLVDSNFFFLPLKSAIRRAAEAAAALLIAAQGSTVITIDLGKFVDTIALCVPMKFLEIHPREPRGAGGATVAVGVGVALPLLGGAAVISSSLADSGQFFIFRQQILLAPTQVLFR